MKLRQRAAITISLCLLASVFWISTTFFIPKETAISSDVTPGHLFRGDGVHLMVARALVDKSSLGTSNSSSPENQVLPEAGIGRKVNNVPEEVRRKYLFQQKPVLEFDASRNYENKVFTPDKLDSELFTDSLNSYSPDELIHHINKYRHQARKTGKRMDIFDDNAIRERGDSLKTWEKWYLNISQYELYRYDDPVIERILDDLSTMPVVFSKQLSGGTQLKMKLSFSNDLDGLWKPMRFTREVETLRNHYYFSDFERHTAEIAGFHLDKIFGFRRTPPVLGRILNITEDIRQYASPRFLKTMFKSPAGDLCFYGKCSYYCDSNHAICGHPDWVEGSVAAFLPPDDVASREHRKNPWRRSYSRHSEAAWEKDEEYCKTVKSSRPPYNHGRALLDLIDLHVFDFIQGNMDRHHYEIFDFPDDWMNDTTPIVLDNGRGWGKMYQDELSILAPLTQCCEIRYSTLQKLLLFETGPYKLSELLDASTSKDPLYPILVSAHLHAADRRVKITLHEIQRCILKLSWEKVVIDDKF